MRPRWPSRRATSEREPRYQVVEVIGGSDQLEEAVGHAAEHIAERRSAGAAGGRRGLRSLALLAAAVAGLAAAGYAAARVLLGGDTATTRPDGTSAEPQSARDILAAGIAEGRRASAEAERELHEDLQRRREGG